MSRTKIILLIILILGIVYGALHNPQTNKYLPEEAKQVTDEISLNNIPFDQLSSKISLNNLPENQATSWLKSALSSNSQPVPISQETNQELQVLSERAVAVGEQTKQVLGASIQPVDENEQPKPIYQTAIESGLYHYCKQVVNDYEKQHPVEGE